VQPGDRIHERKSERPVVLVRLGEQGFLATMREKLQRGVE
jgi:hypothetical protein